jgi:hypothetical protein
VCFTLRVYDLQHEGPHGGLSTEGERSSMAEDAPATFEPGPSTTCHGNCSRDGSRERYLSKEFIERQLNEFDALRQGSHMVPEYEAHFWSCFDMLCTKLPRNLRSRSLSLALLLEFIFYFRYQDYWTEEGVLDVWGATLPA